jgi:hypothetical protein
MIPIPMCFFIRGKIQRHDVCCRSMEGVEGEMKSVLQSYVEDKGRPLGIGFREQVSNWRDPGLARSGTDGISPKADARIANISTI